MSSDQGFRQKPAITPPIWVRLFLYAAALLWGVPGLAVPPPSGVAPVLVPAGGFGIEGDLFANTPGSGSGDWLPGAGGAGGSVLDASGAPLNPATTFHFIDLYNTTSDNTFSGGKWTDDPNTWQWTSSKASSKTDINNVLLHVAFDANGHTWLVIAADRASTSGDSYIDFEFLQNTLTANSNGTFSSAGPNGGRTVNDMVLSLAFTSGGSVADFFAYRWLSSGSGFSYVDSTASLPVGGVFVAANATNTAVPFGAFGQTSYAANAFAEAAIDITALLGNFDPCLSIGVKTIMVKTKVSQSDTATIADFINPIQYSIKLGPSATAGPNQSQCAQGNSTAFTLNGQATQGLQPIASTTWSVVSGIATIDSPGSLVTTARVSSASATLRLTVVQSNGCTETSDLVLTVLPKPSCSITGPTSVCPKSTNPFFGPTNVTSYVWSISGNGSITGATNSATVSVKAGAVCGAPFTLTLTTTGNGCSSTCTMDVLANDTTPPTITPPADRVLECPADTRTNVTGVATAQDNCGQVTVVYNDSVTPGCGGAYMINRMWTATDGCGNSADALQKITVQDTTAPVVTAPANKTIACTDSLDPSVNSSLGLATATDTCSGVATPTYSDQAIPGNCAGNYTVKRTWSAQDACGNIGTALQTITVRDTNGPVITSIPADVTVECPGAVPAADDSAVVATDNCSGPPVISHSDHTVPGTCANKFVVKRTYTATDACGNSSSLTQTITVNDDAAPVITSIPSDITVECASAIPAPDNAAVLATDNCGGAPLITHSDQTISGTCANKFVVKRTYMATDACGNQSSLIQTITINDDTAPVITSIPGDVTVECASAVPAPNDGAVVATDNCGGSPAITHSDQTTPGACVNKFVIKRTYTATDVCGNSSSLIQTITVNDDIAPVISQIPADVTVECASAVPAPNDGAVVATDNCGGSPVITHSDVTTPGTCVNKFVIKRTYTATDPCGNSSDLVQTITVNDDTAPVISSIPADVTVECASAVPAPDDGAVVATDNCGGVPAITHSDHTIAGTCINKFVVKRTYTATDLCGNSSSLVQTITVNDDTAPVITSIPADVTVECASAVPAPNDGAVVATDNCGGVPIITHNDQTIPGTCLNKFVVKRTYTATDTCGNSSSLVQTITVNDDTAPVITSIPADVTVECASGVPAPNDGAVVATDNCGGVPVITHSDQTIPGTCINKFVVKRTYAATDACGNSSSLVQTITVNDDTAPVISSIPADVTVECASAVPAPNDAAVVATDNCGGVRVITHSDQTTPGTCANKFAIKRTYTATDACGNHSSLTQTITVNDDTAPVISSIPADVTVQCASAVPAANDVAVVATDNCSGTPVISHSDQTTVGTCVNRFVIKRTYTATDACGNSSSLVQTITVNDNTAPAITSIPADVTVACASAVPAPNDAAVVATDNCAGAPVITHSDQTTPGTCANKFVIKRTYTATDACGNHSSLTQTITVDDNTAPVITSIPADVTVECASAVPGANDAAVVATDNCGGVAVITHSDQTTPGTCANKFVIKRTYTATDACGNHSSLTQTITVNDDTAPVIGSIPGDVTVQCASAVPAANDAAVVATDNCSGTPVITHSDQTTAGTCVNRFVIKRTYTATDACGNSSSLVQTITVNDNTAPAITSIPADVTVACASAVPAPNDAAVVATDNCAGVPVITHSDQTTPGTCANKFVIKRTYTATDACGNHGSLTQTITVDDNTAPVITSIPADVTVECASAVPPPNDAAVVATDNCGGVAVITHADQTTPGTCANKFVINRTYTATDACGNHSSLTQTITVNDDTAPVISSIPADVTVQCASAVPAANDAAVVATDNCSGTPVITHSDQTTPGGCANKFVIKRTYTATDACGNHSSLTQTINVNDNTAPAITSIPADVTVACASAVPAPNDAAVVATDNCGGVPVITHSDQTTAGSCVNKFVLKRTYTATDACGNASSLTQTITVNDDTPPTLTLPSDLVLECGASTVPSATGTATAQDNCGSVNVAYSDVVTNNCGGTKLIVRTWTAQDACGNSASGVQTITVRDTTPPDLRLPANLVLQCPGDTRTNVTGMASATDGCGSVAISYSDVVSNSCGQTRTVLRLWTATDQCGNTTNGLQTIAVVDTQKPSITCPNIAVQCVGDVPPAYADLATFLAAGGTATDSCDAALTFSQTSDSGLVGRCPGTVTRVYRVTDDCGNFAEVTQKITVDDTIPPVLTCPASLTVECGVSLNPTNIGGVTATDNCSTNVSLAYTDATVQSQYNLSFYVADPDSGTGPYSPTYLKFSPASLPCPQSALLTGRALDPLRNAVAYAPSGQLDALTSIGNVPMAFGQIVPYEIVIQASGGAGPERGTIEVTANWNTYTTSNNRFGYDTNYMVYCAFVDAADPGSIDPNNNARVESYSSVVVNRGTINEAIQGTFRVSGIDSGDRIVVEVWVVLDSTMPSHTGGTVAASLVSAQTAADPPVSITVGTQTDSLGNLSKIFPLPPPQQQPPLGSLPPQPPVLPGATVSVINRTWTATDDCGNQSSCVQQITVRDTAPPVLSAPADRVLEFPADTTTNSTGVATAPDTCGGSVKIFYSDIVSNNCAGTKVVYRTWTAIDISGNTTNVVQTITVRDTTPPTLVGVPADLILGYNDAVPAPAAVTATDTCDPNPSVTFAQSSTQDPDPTKAAHYNYLITRTWTATDVCGNIATGTQKISIQDTIAPVLAGQGAPLTINCPATPAFTAPTATDNFDPNPTITFNDTTTPGACAGAYMVTRTWTATDFSGNVSAPVSQTITVQDTTPPIISCAVADTGTPSDYLGSNDPAVTLQANYTSAFPSGIRIGLPDATSLFWEPTAAGLSALQATLANAPATAGALTQSGTNSTSTLGGGELARQTITLTLNIGLNTAGLLGIAPNNFGSLLYANNGDSLDGATINDMLDAANQALVGQGLPDGYDFTSLANVLSNLNLAYENYSVSLWAASHLSAPNIVVQCAGQVPPPNSAHVTATDGCSGSATITSLPDVISAYTSSNHFTITRTWVAQDACGNTNTCSYLIQVDDTTPPSLTISPNLTVMAGQPWSFGNPSAADNCSPVTVSVVNTVTNMANLTSPTMMVATRTWQAIDAAGNISTCQQSITVMNTTPPALPVITRPPLSQIVGYGDGTTLTVTATSSAPLSYQWQFNGSDIAGATGSALPLTAMQFTNAGVYTVVVSNGGGAVTSPAAIIDVAPKLVAGRTGNGLTLTWPSPFILQSAPNAAGPYTDVAAASPYIPNTSAASRMFFRLRAPAFAVSLLSSGGLGNLLVTGAPGEVFIIQGSTDFVNWTNLQTNTAPSTFVDTTAPPFMMRFYRVILAPLSAGAPVTLPSITAQPQSQTDAYGGSTTLSVSAAGSGPFAYQWFFDGNLIPGATGSSFSLSGLQFTNAGLYSVTVSNAAGTVTSQPAVVNIEPKLAAQTVGQNMTLTWPSPFVLQSATNPAGPYADVPGAISPYSVDLTANPQKFFHLRSAPFMLGISYSSGSQARLDATGGPGWNFVIQASADLTHWANLQTNTIPCTFVDSNASQYNMRFYRMISAQ